MSALDELSGKTPAPVRGCAPVLGGTLLVSAILLTSDTLIDQVAQTGGSAGSFLISLSYLLFPATVSLATVALVFRCKDDRAVSRIALGLLAVSLLSRLVWVSVFDSYQVNDFGYYLQCGADVLREGTPADSGFCDGPYWKRTVFYTLPLVRAFGQSLPALELANVLLATGAGWIFFLVCRMNFGARAAAIALVFFVWNPDLWYSVTLASHDIPGLFWLAIFYYLCSLLQRRLTDPSKGLPGLIVLALCLGGVIFFLDFSRSYHIGAILALALYAAVHGGRVAPGVGDGPGEAAPPGTPTISRAASMRLRIRTAAVRATFLLVIPLCVYRLACAGFWKVSPVEPGQRETGLTCYLSVMDVLGTSNYVEINNWYDRQCALIEGRERTVFAARKVLHDMTNDPLEFLRHVERKNRLLGHADDYIEWSTYGERERWDTSYTQVHRLNRAHLNEQYRMVSLAEIVLLALVVWRLLLYPALPFRRSEFIPFCFSGSYFLMFLLLVECQPRYDIFLIFPFSWMAAQAVVDLRGRIAAGPARAAGHAPRSRARIYLGGALVLVSLAGAYWGAAAAIADGPLTLRDQSGFAPIPADQVVAEARQSPQVAPVFIRNNHKQLMLAYRPGGGIEAGSMIAVQRSFAAREAENHHLRFFISNYSVRAEPFDKQVTWEDTDLEYLIAVNGRIIAGGSVNEIPGNRYFSLYPKDGVVFAPRTTIQLMIRNREKINRVEASRGPIMSLEYIDLR